VARRPHSFDSGDGLCPTLEDFHHSGLEKRLPIAGIVARPITRRRVASVGQFSLLDPIAGLREGRHQNATGLPGIPATVIEVEVAEQNVGHVSQLVPRLPDRLRQPNVSLFHAENAAELGVVLVADAGIHQQQIVSPLHQQAVRHHGDPIQLIRRLLLRPKRLRHHPEHSSAIQAKSAVIHQFEVEISEPHRGGSLSDRWEGVEVAGCFRRGDAPRLKPSDATLGRWKPRSLALPTESVQGSRHYPQV